jgi:hypothetical protein
LVGKKPRDITKVKCFNYNDVRHYAKDCPKVTQDLDQGGFIAKTSVIKLRSNLTLLKFKVGINVVSCFLDSRAMRSFVSPSVVL